jgi:hypothetical protein
MKEGEQITEHPFYQTNSNVGQASVLHIIENAKQTQISPFSTQNQRLPQKNKAKSNPFFGFLDSCVPGFLGS